jgi:chromate transporter
MSGSAFNDAFAISHAAPGPNIIMVSLIGWQLSGLPGLLVATAAIMVPSCTLAFIVSRVLVRYSGHQWLAVVKSGLVPVALGLILASGISMMRMAYQGVMTTVISLAAAAAVVLSSRNPLWALAAGACLSAVVSQFA